MLSGALALIALQVFVGNREGPARAGGLLADLAGFATRLIDPTVPALGPVKTSSSSTGSSSSGPSGSSTSSASTAPDSSTTPTYPSPLPVSRKVAL